MTEKNITEKNRKGVSLLDEVLERRMLLYVLAAGATLAGASAAQAKVVFTPSNAYTHFSDKPYYIDLDNDGNADLYLYANDGFCTSNGKDCFEITTAFPLGASTGFAASSMQLPLALTKGAKIGSSANFTTRGVLAGSSAYSRDGNFLNTRFRFLGVRFLINGRVHYAWVGFRKVDAGFARLLGWAYETEPNTSIPAGDMGEEHSATLRSVEPTSLQLLAMGHTGIADRQRRIAASANS